MIAVGAGASGCLNMWWDADVDALMVRTRKRDPGGQDQPRRCAGVRAHPGGGLGAHARSRGNWLAAGMLAFTIVFYAVIYSMWLKRATPQNIVVGGAAGALPVVAQATVTGQVTLEGLVLFAIIFMWTPPHFWALALVKSDDYVRAGIPMMPNIAGPDATRSTSGLCRAPRAARPGARRSGSGARLRGRLERRRFRNAGARASRPPLARGRARDAGGPAPLPIPILYLFALFTGPSRGARVQPFPADAGLTMAVPS